MQKTLYFTPLNYWFVPKVLPL